MIKETLLATYTPVNEGLANGATPLGQVGTAIGDSGAVTLPMLVGNVINVLLAALGIVFVGLLIFAGVLYFTSAGEKEPTDKAKKILKTSITGLIIIVAAYAIANYVMGALVTATAA